MFKDKMIMDAMLLQMNGIVVSLYGRHIITVTIPSLKKNPKMVTYMAM